MCLIWTFSFFFFFHFSRVSSAFFKSCSDTTGLHFLKKESAQGTEADGDAAFGQDTRVKKKIKAESLLRVTSPL